MQKNLYYGGNVNTQLIIEILEYLDDHYPQHICENYFREYLHKIFPDDVSISSSDGLVEDAFKAECTYLIEHGFIEVFTQTSTDTIGEVKITASGRDYLQNDHGLSRYKSTVTVEFTEETIRIFFDNSITAAEIPEEEKQTLRTTILNLPNTALQKVLEKLIEKGIENPHIWMNMLNPS